MLNSKAWRAADQLSGAGDCPNVAITFEAIASSQSSRILASLRRRERRHQHNSTTRGFEPFGIMSLFLQ
jgi:hypothetical protein